MPSYSYLCKKAGLPVPGPAPYVPQTRHPLPKPECRAPIALPTALTCGRVNLSPEAAELFNRLFAQLGAHEDKHFSVIYELAIKLFPVVYGRMPCDIAQFQTMRTTVANGGKVPFFD